jgi:hypothetical protein
MAVTFDSGDHFRAAGFTNPQPYTGHTVGAGSNAALIVVIFQDNTSGALSSLTANWDSTGTNQSMTLIGSGNANQTFYVFGLVAPTQGNKTLSINTSSGSAAYWIVVASFFGVNQTGGTTSFPNLTFANNQTTIAITSPTGDMAFCVADSIPNVPGMAPTQIFIDNTGNNIQIGSDYAAGSGTVNLGFSSGTARDLVGIDIAQVAVAYTLMSQIVM